MVRLRYFYYGRYREVDFNTFTEMRKHLHEHHQIEWTEIGKEDKPNPFVNRIIIAVITLLTAIIIYNAYVLSTGVN